MSGYEPGAALRRCTGLDRAEFETAYWSSRPLVARRVGGPDGFSDLLCASDVDELIADRGLRQPSFRMVKAGSTIADQGTKDALNADAVREQFEAGATLVLQSLQQIHPPLVRFCRRLAMDLGHRTQCNSYLTPPGSQGFAAHHDTHDVFVLQVEGHKRWNVHSPVLTLPLKSQPSKSLAGSEPLVPPDAEPLLSVVLGPGDALYLPRGFIHAAETGHDRSIHLTVGVMATTRYDVLRDVLSLAADEPRFRQALPLGSPQEQLAPIAELIAEAARWMQELPAEQLHDAARERVTAVAPAEPLGMFALQDHVRELGKETVVRPREALRVELIEHGERIVLQLADRELSLPAYTGPALAALLSGSHRVDELDLAIDDALVLVRRLLREGVVTVG